MTPAKALILFLFLIVCAHGQQNTETIPVKPGSAEPHLPVIDFKACPFEGCTFGKWKVTKASTVYSSWRENRRPIGQLKPEDEVIGLTGVHVTHKPDRILVKSAIPDLGLKSGDVVLRYMYLGEGFANVWFNGTWHKSEDCTFITEKNGQGCLRDCLAIVTEVGVKDWWVQVKTPNGKIGWVLVRGNFDGMDAFA